jgi:ribosomal-protein-alanine N-acetyltransferase
MDDITSTPILETARLGLRPIRMSDADRMQELFPHFELLKYMAAIIPWPYPDDGSVQFLDRILPEVEAGTRFTWAITIKERNDDLLIGVMDLFPYQEGDHRGFWLGLDYQRQGYMTEAVRVVNDFAFDVLGLEHLQLNNAQPNIGSHRLKEKAGATIIAVDDDVPFIGGRFPRVRWLLTREQWRANRERFIGVRPPKHD